MIRKSKKYSKEPIEKHETASWANIKETTEKANVPIPSEMEVINAKKWVDENEK
ncbi:DUF3787 domain-containing protein [Thermoanaerobacterium sp. RBIITD]|uniref:CDIF630_02480 family spore surface protein n=1 Tax=Thermoanaerobacterium sp. RBIITD TaxID=1550240 RepID=UPI000BB89225|nr:DUF3787 domain-containing protein [Thermoanaerobacterium sp. RBIITD]SNX54251.1 protein of unknown function [Thermoanaerobacterium sp. RBIITD]